MNPSAKLLYVGLILLALGLGGLYFYWGAGDRGLVEAAAGTDPRIACSLRVERGYVYEVSLSTKNSVGLPWNKVDVEASVLFDGETIYSDSFAASEFLGKSARDGFSFRADVRSDGLLEVDGYMREGQRWRVSVYRDLPPLPRHWPLRLRHTGAAGHRQPCPVRRGLAGPKPRRPTLHVGTVSCTRGTPDRV